MHIICLSHITSCKLSWFCSPSQSSQLRSWSDSEWFGVIRIFPQIWHRLVKELAAGQRLAAGLVPGVGGERGERPSASGFSPHGDTRYSLDQSWPIPISSQCCAMVSGLETYVKSLWIRVNLVCKVAILVTVWYWQESIYLQCGQTRWVGTTFHTHFSYAWLRCFRTETILALYVILFLSLELDQEFQCAETAMYFMKALLALVKSPLNRWSDHPETNGSCIPRYPKYQIRLWMKIRLSNKVVDQCNHFKLAPQLDKMLACLGLWPQGQLHQWATVHKACV